MDPVWGQMLRGELGTFLLECARITGLVMVSPVLFEGAAKQAKIAIVILLAILVHGQSSAHLVELADPLRAFVFVGSELLLGISIGFVVRLAVAIAEIGGTTLAPVMGFGAAQMFDPGTGQQDSVLTRLFRMIAILIALIIGLHRVIIASLMGSFRVLPVGSAFKAEVTAWYFIELSSGVLNAGVRLVLPLLAILFMAQLALGFVARAAPSMQIFSIGFTLLLGLGGGLLVVLFPEMASVMGGNLSQVGGQIETLLLGLVGS